MATSKDRLKDSIYNAMVLAKAETNPENAEQAMQSFANALATAIVNEITSATVVHTLTAPNGAVTGQITIE